ncbi:MAG: hypothetical protein EBR28_09130 [Planctomycetia bacterium]|nr:hypothetical protein [Planctomycetia bacterium]
MIEPASAAMGVVSSINRAAQRRAGEELVDMAWDPAFEMEFSAVGSASLPAIASGGCDPDGSRDTEAVEKWW